MGPIHTNDEEYVRFSGTSMACPHAVGMAARFYSEMSDAQVQRFSPEKMKARLIDGATSGAIRLDGVHQRATRNRYNKFNVIILVYCPISYVIFDIHLTLLHQSWESIFRYCYKLIFPD